VFAWQALCGLSHTSRLLLFIFKNHLGSGCRWLSPVIPATQEAEMKDSGSKPARANSSRDSILKTPNTEKGWWSGPRCRP
jgi:hypothetical protein